MTAHASGDEEIFYPALREALKETDVLPEAEVEHSSAKDLISQIKAMDYADGMFDAKVKVLGEYIDRPGKRNGTKSFPKLVRHKATTWYERAENCWHAWMRFWRRPFSGGLVRTPWPRDVPFWKYWPARLAIRV